MMNVILWVSVGWLPLLLYFFLRNETRFKKNIAVGVTLPKEAREDAEVQAALAVFKKGLLRVCVGLTVAALLCMIAAKDFAAQYTLWCIWIIAAVTVPYVPYVQCNRSLRAIKRERGWQREQKETIVNIQAAAMPVRWLSPWMFLLPFAVSLVPFIYERSFWPMYLMDALMVLGCFGGYRYLYRTRAETVDDNLALTEALTRIRRYNWGKYWLFCAWLLALLNLVSSCCMQQPLLMTALTLLLCFGAIAAVIGVEFRTRKIQEKLTEKSGTDFYVDEDDRWIWGLFYYNPDDTHLIVNQRVGTGTTVNLARRSGRIICGVSALALLSLPLLGIWIGREASSPVVLEYSGETIAAEHAGTHYSIPLAEISSVELFDELPSVHRVWGTGMDSVLKGSFSSEWGTITLCLDPRTGPWILLEGEKETYLVGSSEQDKAEEIYTGLSEALAGSR